MMPLLFLALMVFVVGSSLADSLQQQNIPMWCSILVLVLVGIAFALVPFTSGNLTNVFAATSGR